MKKWQKMTVALTMASTLVVPSFASAVTVGKSATYEYNLLERLNLSPQGKSKQIFDKKEEEKVKLSEDTLVVKYDSKLSSSDHRRAGAYVVRSYPELGYEVVKLQKGKEMDDVLKSYQLLDSVLAVAPSVKLELYGKNDPKASKQYQLSLLEIDKALSLAGENEVTVAVIDGGVDTEHPELKNRVLPPYNVTDPANPGYPDAHGTHVAGIIAAEADNGVGGQGINPNAKILPINVFDRWGGFDYALADAILYAAENNADVINMSLGAPFEMPLVEEAIKVAVDKGVVVVAAAGNDGRVQYNYPASYDGVITVGATDDKNEKTVFTTYGPSIDVVAPGEEVYSTLYDYQKGSTFAEMSGTSMASPIVAGVASLIKSKYPELNSYEVEAILEQTAKDLGDKGFDIEYGYGIVDPVAALNYDISNLPDFSGQSDEEILTEAVALTVEDEVFTRTGKLMTPNETDWLKIDVAAGEYIQTTLSGTDNYDYKAILRFYPEGKTESNEPIEVKSVRHNLAEGYAFKAPENGTLVVGVTDENENYSKEGLSTYDLSLQRFAGIVEDQSTKQAPFEISELPFEGGTFYLATEDAEADQEQALTEGPVKEVEVIKSANLFDEDLETEEAVAVAVDESSDKQPQEDKDYYKFMVETPTNVQIKLSDIAGLNTQISLYNAFDLEMPMPEGLPEWEKENWPWPMEVANRKGTSEGEILSFEAYPGMEYVVEVSAATNNYLDPYVLIYPPVVNEEQEKKVATSLIPYNLTVETKELPEDEDMYPEVFGSEFGEIPADKAVTVIEEEPMPEAYADVISVTGYSSWSYFQKEEVEKIMNAALPMNIGDENEGYFQTRSDQDWYTFSVDETAIYELKANNTDTLQPFIDLFEYDDEEETLYEVSSSWMYWNPFASQEEEETKLVLALEEGKEYYLQLSNNYQLSFDPYTLSSSKVMAAPVDENEDNNELIKATVLQDGSKKTGNFVLQNDVDIYYYKHRADTDVFGFSAKPIELSKDETAALPEELTMPLDLVVSIIEDTNGNMDLNDTEINQNVIFDRSWNGDPESGSFKAKKDVGYFIVVDSWIGTANITDYELSLFTANGKDEDAGSTVTNNVPSKPLALTKDAAGLFTATGKFNAGVDFGDKDTYKLNVTEAGTVEVTLTVPEELDGVISVYDANGKLVDEFDFYSIGDDEVATLDVAKGTYYVEVKDFFGRSSNESYQLTVEQ